MTVDEPLSYDSLKSVLLHMEPNFRFKLSYQIPSIQSAEKATPLHVDWMVLEPNQFTINNNVYKMEVVREYRNCQKPETQELLDDLEKDDNGFVIYPYDVCMNSIEIRDWKAEHIMTPGDVKIEAEDEKELIEEAIEDLEAQLQADESMLIRLKEARENNEITQWNPDLMQQILFDFLQCEYSTYLKFTVKSPSETHVEYFEYNRKIPQTMKKLYKRILGERCHIPVTKLYIDQHGGILRLPKNLKLIIVSLYIGQNARAVCDSLAPLIYKERFPLDIIIHCGHIFGEAENYKHQMIQNAEYLEVISEFPQVLWLDMLWKVSVPNIYLDCKKFPNGDFKMLMDNWLENGKGIGTRVALGIDDENDVEELLKSVREHPNAIIEEIQGKGCFAFGSVITIPMKNNSELSVRCEETTDEDEFNEYARWKISLQVITAQHRHLWNVDYDDTFFN